MQDADEIAHLLKSRIPLIAIETREERRAVDLIKSMQFRLAIPIFEWTVTEGLRRIDLDYEPQRHNADPAEVLGNIKAGGKQGIYILLDFHPYLSDPMHVRLLKDIALSYEHAQQSIVLVSHEIKIPPELRNFSARFQLALPDQGARRAIVKNVAEQYAKQHLHKVKAQSAALEALVNNLSGLTHAEATRLARTAIYDDGAITPEDLPTLLKGKYALLSKDGMLHLETNTEAFSNVGGFSRLKSFLRQRQAAFEGRLNNLDMPKGVLLLGVQGCGKSLAAKAVAGVLGIPLLRLDVGALFNKFHGETERNLRETLKAAENMAPCVLWIDELEKAISQGDHDGGTSRRLLGSLLTWMADKQSAVFIVATANDIDSLPPELVRKGRFDEIFFVDLPDSPTRERIFEIHLRKRGHEATEFDLARLAAASEGFSGAEVEQAVVAAIYAAHAQEQVLNQMHVLQEIKLTRPLSIVMAERIQALRQWAQARTVPVD